MAKSNDDEDDNIIDEAEYSNKSDFSKAFVVQTAVQKVFDLRSNEMREGYNNFITLPTGETKRIYVPDTRKAFIGSVESLKSLLAPEINLDSRVKKSLKKFYSKKNKLFNKYKVRKINAEGLEIKKTDEEYIPELDEEIPYIAVSTNPQAKRSNRTIQFQKGYWNYKVKKYWDDMIKVYDYLFTELNILISNRNYFKQKSTY